METEQDEEERLLVVNDESGLRRSQHKGMQNFEKKTEKLQDEAITRNQESEEDKQNSSLRQRMQLSFLFLSGRFWEESTEPREIWEKEKKRAHMKGMVNGEDCAEPDFFFQMNLDNV